MGKFRSKLKGKNNGKRWPKGQSSNSNPTIQKYRNQAKSRFFQEQIGPSNLTSNALKKHDAVCNTNLSEMDDDSEAATTFRSIDTFATDWTECSNTSFNHLFKTFRTDSALHKEMLAVLAAVTEVIKTNGGSETATEYYAALMTTLEVSETEESISAIMSLLAMGLKSVPQPVLRIQFSVACEVFIKILSKFSDSENNVILRSALTCLSIFLRALEVTVWSSSSTIHTFESLLAFVIHTKPRVRKSAQHAVCAILKGSSFMLGDNPPLNHPAAINVARFCIQQIESCVSGSHTTTLHTLFLMKEIIDCFPKQQIKGVCESMLKIMTLNNILISSCCLQVMHSLFSKQTPTISATVNAQLINALYDYKPAATDAQPTLAWLAVMEKAHVHLADVDITMCMSILPRIFKTLVELWLTERQEIINGATLSLKVLVQDCFGHITENTEMHANAIQQCLSTLEPALSYQYNTTWNQVLFVWATVFEIIGSQYKMMLTKYISILAQLRDSYKFSFNNELERAIGAAVKTMGPEIILQTIPLTKSNNEINIDRSWLLPILKYNIRCSSLEFFASYILPLAAVCQKKATEMKEKHDGVGTHSMELLVVQLWALLPSFCNMPSDIQKSFKNVAKTFGSVIADRKDLRLSVMAAIRKLIVYSKENDKTEDIIELSRFAKNYLPILFNIYTTKANGSEEEGQRLAALDTIKVYLLITSPELCHELFNRALDKVQDTTTEHFVSESLYDLIRTLAVYQTYPVLDNLYKNTISVLLTSKNQKEQKKAYRVLEDICKSDQPGCKEFVKVNCKVLQKILLKTLDSTGTSSKRTRLKCLNLLIKSMPFVDGNSKIVREAVAESVASLKDINERCRAAANELLATIGEELQRSKQRDIFITLLIAGLAGNTNLIASTILALTTCVYNFTGALGQDNLQQMLESVCQLMQSNSREIVLSALCFLKVYLTALPTPLVASSLSLIVKSVSSINEDCKGHFRIKIRNILDRLIRKYSYDSISSIIPSKDVLLHRCLKNIRKMNARKKRLREKAKSEENNEEHEPPYMVKSKPQTMEEILADSDSDDENEKNTQQSKFKSSTWIRDDVDDITDFTDASAIGKIVATNPTHSKEHQVQEKKKKNQFKTANDGRLIITDNIDDSDDEKKNKLKLNFDSDDDDIEDNKSAASTAVLSSGKRKRPADTVSVSSGRPLSKYRPGGSGIHRKLPGSEYQAPKAKGDVKKKGQVDPYAYLPFSRSTLNKRKRLKNDSQFKNIIKGAKRGVKKGLKANKKTK